VKSHISSEDKMPWKEHLEQVEKLVRNIPADQFPSNAAWMTWAVKMMKWIEAERAKLPVPAAPPKVQKVSGAKPPKPVERSGKKTNEQKIAAAKASEGLRKKLVKKGDPK
jgi:hypothetical protein